MNLRSVASIPLLPAAIGIAAIAAAAGVFLFGSRSVPQLEIAPVSQFRMGPLGTPVSQTVRADDFTIETIELRLTSRSETPVRFAIGVWSANSSALVREALVEVPAQTADVWTRIDFAPLKLESDDTLEFQFFLPEREAGEIYIGAGLEDQ